MKERLLEKIKKNGDCWEWQGFIAKMPSGYGYVTYEGKSKLVHRVSYIVFKGEIPKGKLVCHTCDNRRCINPDHLWLGTHKDNAQDAFKKGRLKPVWGRKKTQEEKDKIQKNRKIPDQKGIKQWKAILNNEKVIEIRKLLSEKMKYREISEKFGIAIRSIADIKFRRTWKHI